MGSNNRLTARAVIAAKNEGRYADGAGLYLQIKNGGKSWLFMYRDRATGKRKEMGLGAVADVSLAAARVEASDARTMLARGGLDPLTEKRAKRAAAKTARTFGDFCDEFLESTALKGLRNGKHRKQWKSTLNTYAAPLRLKLLNAITAEDVRQVLAPIWHTKPDTAKRVRGRIERVLAAAKAAGLREGDNPAAWKDNLKPMLGEQPKSDNHHAAIPYADLPEFMQEVRELDSTSADALELLILTVARTGEVIGATAEEINWKEKIWTVPGKRMKKGKEHVVPLCDRAMEILEKRKRKKGLLFAGADSKKPLSDMAILECVRGLREGITAHGMRSAFRDWCGNETSFPKELAEEALAHVILDKTEAAYRRGIALKKRRELMEAWSRYLSVDKGNVVTMKRPA